MTNYNAYAPIVKETYARLEAENDQRQKEFEARYLEIYKDKPMEAQDMLQQFSDDILNRALEVADTVYTSYRRHDEGIYVPRCLKNQT